MLIKYIYLESFRNYQSEKIELNIKKNRTKFDYEKMLKKLETEVIFLTKMV